jgi:hypothetical protein
VSIAEYIGVRTTALQRRVLPVTAITTPLAGAHTGAQVLALVGTDPTDRSKAIGFKWRSGVCAPGRCVSELLIAVFCPSFTRAFGASKMKFAQCCHRRCHGSDQLITFA